MDKLNENASTIEIITKVNEIIDYIEKWRTSILEEEIREIRYQTASDKFFREELLPVLGKMYDVIQ